MRNAEAMETEAVEQFDESNESIVNADDDLLFLKSAVIAQTDLDVVKRKLNTTRSLRADMMQNKNIDLREHFPFFFSHPFLVSWIFYYSSKELYSTSFSINPFTNNCNFQMLYDFEQKYKLVESNALKIAWPVYSEHLRRKFAAQEKYNIKTAWTENIENFLLLLKILPSKPKSGSLNFFKITEKLIVFSVVSVDVKK